MRPHSKTELTAFFIKSLIERMISEWRNVTMFCLMWIAALLPIHSDFVQGFFFGADCVITVVFFAFLAADARLDTEEKKWRVSEYVNSATGQVYRLTLRPVAAHSARRLPRLHQRSRARRARGASHHAPRRRRLPTLWPAPHPRGLDRSLRA